MNTTTHINHGLRADALLTTKALVATPWYLLTSLITGSAKTLRTFEGGRKLEATTVLELAKGEGQFGDWFNSFLADAIDSLMATMTYSSNSLTTDEAVIADTVAKARAGGDAQLEKELAKKIRIKLHMEKRRAIASGKKLSASQMKSNLETAIQEAIASWSKL